MTASPSAPLREIAPGLLVRSAAALPPLGHFRLIAFDMDSTLINIECVDEIAAAAGRGAEVATITKAARTLPICWPTNPAGCSPP